MTILRTSPIGIIGSKVAEVHAAGDLVFDAEAVAPLLGLTAKTFMDDLRKGILYQMFERGTEEDLGKSRVTFRHRARQAILTIDDHGRVLDVT
ncbi:DUF6522 family protein [Skermanella mucosa]|uniref:DUF6522 family protein n=1 Tax=Skermanella mucosa TaxID=1789672 RepID=UPI00192B40AE|nr:DUF6522 family protein [Skermanella mucosa]UEM20841.1 DUF6522 family protein [Skermanella mucosa]